MEPWATDPECRDYLHAVTAAVEERLNVISELAVADRIRLSCQVALAADDEPFPEDPRYLRVGVYPVAANPMHWGHVLVGLSAMALLQLDKVVFIIAGTDIRKPFMVSAENRHRLGRTVIETFNPLIAYSPLALGTDLDGETNFGRLLKLNAQQALEAYYIAGGDHYRRTTSEGEPDTVQKLERVVEEEAKGGNTHHDISAVFIDRDGETGQREQVSTSLNVHFLPPIPFSVSSTAVRNALRRDDFSEDLVSLPYSCFLEIRSNGLYRDVRERLEKSEPPAQPLPAR